MAALRKCEGKFSVNCVHIDDDAMGEGLRAPTLRPNSPKQSDEVAG